MVQGGGRDEGADQWDAAPRSRTALVMDHLLSRGPFLSRPTSVTTGRPAESDPWAAVWPVLRAADETLVANHLSWLLSVGPGDGNRPSSSQLEDQIRILVRALDERHEHDLLVEVLDEISPWAAGAVAQDDETLIAYGADLTVATDGQGEDSPYLTLAAGAVQWAALVLDHRSSSPARPPRA